MKKIIKLILMIVVLLIALIIGGVLILLFVMGNHSKNYWKYADPKGELEAKYTFPGECSVEYIEYATDEEWKKYEIFYPAEIKDSNSVYPVVIMANGTGVKASQYKEVLKHLASWGFVVIGNEDENSRTGLSSAESLDFVLSLSEDESGVFYGKIDVENIGIAGHSQGGVAVINAINNHENGKMYKAAFTASTTSPVLASENVLGADWCYDISKVKIPCFMVAGTGAADAGTAMNREEMQGQGICPLWSLNESFEALKEGCMARLTDKDHGDMLRMADGYMTAWFMYYLKGDAEAGKVFFGDNPEILNNSRWQDVRIQPAP